MVNLGVEHPRIAPHRFKIQIKTSAHDFIDLSKAETSAPICFKDGASASAEKRIEYGNTGFKTRNIAT
jgi:hypothetical protein